ncbi:MAG: helix-turn-helix domain-containing protein [Ilumatobacter sp.]
MKSHRVRTVLDLAPSNRRKLPEGRTPRRRTFTVPEVAQILGVGRSTAYALVRSGEINALCFGARLVVTCAEVDRLLGDNPAA